MKTCTRNDELYHYGVAGMKWGKRKGSLMSTVSNNIKEKMVRNHEDKILKGTSNPIYKKQLEKSIEYKQKRRESAKFKTTKGKEKAAMILSKIGKTVLNPNGNKKRPSGNI